MAKRRKAPDLGPEAAPPRKLSFNPGLEEAVRAAPHDVTRWAVLEDWMLENEDPRAEAQALEQLGKRGEAEKLRARHLKLLFGEDAESMTRSLLEVQWRSGFLEQVELECVGATPRAALGQLLILPVSGLMRELKLRLVGRGANSPELLGQVVGDLCDHPCARTLRALTLFTQAGGGLKAAALDRLGVLEELHLLGSSVQLAPGPALSKLKALTLTDARPDALDVLLAEPRPLLGQLSWHATGDPGLSRLLKPGNVPALHSVLLHTNRGHRALLDALAASQLAKQLKRISLGYTTVPLEQVRATVGAAFPQLETLSAPPQLFGS